MKCELSKSAPDMAALGLESKSPHHMPVWWVLSSGKPTPLPAGANSWKKRKWSRSLSGLTWKVLLGQWRSGTADDCASHDRALTCYAPGSPVSHTATPASAEEPKTSDGSGQPFGAPLAYWDRASFSWKMSQASLLMEDSAKFSGTYPRSGSMRNGILYQRPTRARITSASGYSSSRGAGMMPTPDASPGGPDYARASRDGSGGGDIATYAARMQMRTPAATDAFRGAHPNPDMKAGAHSLVTQVYAMQPQMLNTPCASDAAGSRSTKGSKRQNEGGIRKQMQPTPQANDWKSGTGYEHGDKKQTPQLRHQAGGMLNPRPVEWMMGLPKNFLKAGSTIAPMHQTNGSPETSQTEPSSYTRSAMESYLSRQRLLLHCLLAERGCA